MLISTRHSRQINVLFSLMLFWNLDVDYYSSFCRQLNMNINRNHNRWSWWDVQNCAVLQTCIREPPSWCFVQQCFGRFLEISRSRSLILLLLLTAAIFGGPTEDYWWHTSRRIDEEGWCLDNIFDLMCHVANFKKIGQIFVLINFFCYCSLRLFDLKFCDELQTFSFSALFKFYYSELYYFICENWRETERKYGNLNWEFVWVWRPFSSIVYNYLLCI